MDLVAGLIMTAIPDAAPPLLNVDIEGLARPIYRVYPLVDHIADKVCAIYQMHTTADGIPIASSRIKDFVDLAIIAATQRINALALRTALLSETARNNLTVPNHFAVPNESLWMPGYEKLASESGVLAGHRTYEAGRQLVAEFLNPIFDDAAIGTWQPNGQTWQTDLFQ